MVLRKKTVRVGHVLQTKDPNAAQTICTNCGKKVVRVGNHDWKHVGSSTTTLRKYQKSKRKGR